MLKKFSMVFVFSSMVILSALANSHSTQPIKSETEQLLNNRYLVSNSYFMPTQYTWAGDAKALCNPGDELVTGGCHIPDFSADISLRAFSTVVYNNVPNGDVYQEGWRCIFDSKSKAEIDQEFVVSAVCKKAR